MCLRRGEAFLLGAVLLMGAAMHLWGLGVLLHRADRSGSLGPALPWAIALFWLHASAVLALSGWRTGLRAVTALAILPFAQLLATGAFYAGSAYVFVSEEPTLSILQMSALLAACLVLQRRAPPRIARHAAILAIMAFVTANLCALVGSLGGDVIGSSWTAPRLADFQTAAPGTATREEINAAFDAFLEARQAFYETARRIPAGTYALAWAAALAALGIWSAATLRRGLFNTAVTFAAIHAYTQLMETLDAAPLAWLLAGLSDAQPGCASGQRLRNGQPESRAVAEGSSPSSFCRAGAAPGFGGSTAERSARV